MALFLRQMRRSECGYLGPPDAILVAWLAEADGALDKTRRHKKRQLEESLDKVVKKQKEYEEKMREKGEEPVMFRWVNSCKLDGSLCISHSIRRNEHKEYAEKIGV